MNENINKRGWHEKANPLTEKAPIHQAVAQKKEFSKEFNGVKASVRPKNVNTILHFSLMDDDIDKFIDLVLVQFRKYYGFCEIYISRDENNKTCVEIPKNIALPFHDFILSKNVKWGADVKELIALQEDSFANSEGIDTRLRALR